jgi:hypothetical protein
LNKIIFSNPHFRHYRCVGFYYLGVEQTILVSILR